jgi:hypothetical protein
VLLAIDVSLWQTTLAQQIANQINEPIHLSAARDSRPSSGVPVARCGTLLLGLRFASGPEVFHGSPKLVIEPGTHFAFRTSIDALLNRDAVSFAIRL